MTDIAFSEAPLFGDEPDVPTTPFTASTVPQDRKKKKRKDRMPSPQEAAPVVAEPKPAPTSDTSPSAKPKIEPVAKTAPAAAPTEKPKRDVMEMINAISDIVEEFPDHANSIAYMAQRLQKITNNEIVSDLILAAVTVVIAKAALKQDPSQEVDHE